MLVLFSSTFLRLNAVPYADSVQFSSIQLRKCSNFLLRHCALALRIRCWMRQVLASQLAYSLRPDSSLWFHRPLSTPLPAPVIFRLIDIYFCRSASPTNLISLEQEQPLLIVLGDAQKQLHFCAWVCIQKQWNVFP